MSEWTTELTVDFVPLPPEKEEAYWAAIHYFAEVMFEEYLKSEAMSVSETDMTSTTAAVAPLSKTE